MKTTSLKTAALLFALPSAAHAAPDEWGLGALRDPFVAEDPALDPTVTLGGYFRLRGDVFDNLDLNRGPTPTTGETIFPVPIDDPEHNDRLTSSNMRLRLEPHIRVGWEVNVHAVIDCLDDVILGSTPADESRWAGMSAATTNQEAPADSIRMKRAWAEIGTPIGLLTAGRMGVQWGLGMLANDGNCFDCDLGNTVDSIGLAIPVGGQIVGLSYDVASTGPQFSPWGGVGQSIDRDPERRREVAVRGVPAGQHTGGAQHQAAPTPTTWSTTASWRATAGRTSTSPSPAPADGSHGRAGHLARPERGLARRLRGLGDLAQPARVRGRRDARPHGRCLAHPRPAHRRDHRPAVGRRACATRSRPRRCCGCAPRSAWPPATRARASARGPAPIATAPARAIWTRRSSTCPTTPRSRTSGSTRTTTWISSSGARSSAPSRMPCT